MVAATPWCAAGLPRFPQFSVLGLRHHPPLGPVASGPPSLQESSPAMRRLFFALFLYDYYWRFWSTCGICQVKGYVAQQECRCSCVSDLDCFFHAHVMRGWSL